MGGKPDTHWLPQGLASGKGKAGPKRVWLTVGYVLVEPKKLKSQTKIQKTLLQIEVIFQDGKGKEKGKREPRQTFQSQKEMDKDSKEDLSKSTTVHDQKLVTE